MPDETHPIQSDESLQEANFEPSPRTKRAYYGLRKVPLELGGFKMPGLFQYDLGHDQWWFLGAMFMEVVSLLVLGLSLQDAAKWYWLVMAALLAIILDVALAFWHHRPKADKCQLDNELLRIFQSMRTGQAHGMPLYKDYAEYCRQLYRRKTWGRRFVAHVCCFTIVFMVFVKSMLLVSNFTIASSWDVSGSGENSSMWIVAVLILIGIYSWIAYIHLNNTGFYLHYLAFKQSFQKDKSEFNASGYGKAYRRQKRTQDLDLSQFVKELQNTGYRMWTDLVPKEGLDTQIKKGIETDMKDFQEEVYPHKIYKKDGPDGDDAVYVIERNGLLEDRELQSMVERQPTPIAKAAVAIWGHYLQLLSFEGMEGALPGGRDAG